MPDATIDANKAPGATERLADFLAPIRFGDLPGQAIDSAKIFVLDLIGCALGAMKTEEARIAAEVTESLGGTPECSAIGFTFKTSSQNAAYLNGISSHVIELDDTHRSSITHVGAAVIPAALAIAERDKASGAAFLSSVVVGYEACLRVANAVQPGRSNIP